MDARDRLRLRLVGTGCGACGQPYVASGISVLAQRDDLAFVLLHCASCGSDGLGLVTSGEPDDAVTTPDRPEVGGPKGEFTADDERRFRDEPPITGDDVLVAHELLARTGDIGPLLGDAGPGAGRA